MPEVVRDAEGKEVSDGVMVTSCDVEPVSDQDEDRVRVCSLEGDFADLLRVCVMLDESVRLIDDDAIDRLPSLD